MRKPNTIPLTPAFDKLWREQLSPEHKIKDDKITFIKAGPKVGAEFYIQRASGGFGMDTTIWADSIPELEQKVIKFIQ